MTPVIRIACSLLTLLAVFSAFVPGVQAAAHSVAPSGAEFTSIQAAIDWAYPGDTIHVQSGTYAEEIRLDKKIALIGVDNGGGSPVIDTGGEGNAVEVRVDGCVIDGFTIRNSSRFNGIHISSSNNTIRQNTISGGAKGISLLSAMKNLIYGNTITDSSVTGIALEASGDNLIQENILVKNTVGIALDEFSLSNLIYLNNFDNPQNVYSKSATSIWSSPSPFTYTHLGLRKQSYMGNYWGDYRGKDNDGDGIGDTPYGIMIGANPKAILETNRNIVDSYPLMDPRQFYHDPVPVQGATDVAGPGQGGGLIPTPTQNIVDSGTTANVSDAPSPGDGRPTGILMFELIVLLIAGVVVLLIFRSLKQNESRREGPPIGAGPSVLQGGNGSVSPVPDGSPPADTANQTPSTYGAEQLSYFPKELEGKYTEIRYIGRGGIAWVFSARRKADEVIVAVKIPISFDEATGKSFLNEIAAWETLRHPNIIEVTAVNILPVPYVEMEYVPKSLETLGKPVPIWKAVHIVSGVANGLSYAHTHGFIHRDIKPHNILLNDDFIPKITDWGMSKVLTTEMRRSSIAGFSLAYAAPEQVSPTEYGRTDERTDIYQLGVVFYELVTGSVPFGGEGIVEVGNAILREQPIAPSEYNTDAAAVEKIIFTCLEKDPSLRYQTAEDLLAALHAYLDEEER